MTGQIESPERHMYRQALVEALNDYFNRIADLQGPNKRNERRQARDDARSFLFDKTGPWAQSREDICYAAGVDPDAFREQAMRKRLELKRLGIET